MKKRAKKRIIIFTILFSVLFLILVGLCVFLIYMFKSGKIFNKNEDVAYLIENEVSETEGEESSASEEYIDSQENMQDSENIDQKNSEETSETTTEEIVGNKTGPALGSFGVQENVASEAEMAYYDMLSEIVSDMYKYSSDYCM